MITIEVYMQNGDEFNYEIITITKEELLQLACNKAEGMYESGNWNRIIAKDSIIIKL